MSPNPLPRRVASLLLLAVLPVLSFGQVQQYGTRSAFNAVLSDGKALDFEGLTPPGSWIYYGGPASATIGGLQFDTPNRLFVQNANYYGTGAFMSVQQLDSPYTVRITLPAGVTAFGFDYSSGVPLSIRLSTGETVVADPIPYWPSLRFAGVVSRRPIEYLDVTNTGGFDLDNIAYGHKKTRAVLCVHGTWSDSHTWDDLTHSLRSGASPYTVEAVDFPREPETMLNEASIDLQAQAIARRVRELQDRSGEAQVDLVCHSMGGLAGRYYLEHPEIWQTTNGSGVNKIVMLGTPNWGLDGFLLDPVGSICVAILGASPVAVDRIANWSPALQQMYAEWEPAPNVLSATSYSYPSGLSLTSWPLGNDGSLLDPIPLGSYNLAFDLETIYIGRWQWSAIHQATSKFPELKYATRLRNHVNYYHDTSATLGVLTQFTDVTSPMVEGVNSRRVSPFLIDLNSRSDPSGATPFLAAGTAPLAYPALLVFGPYSLSLANDGVVPTDSALFREPLSGELGYPNAQRALFPIGHTEMTSDSGVMSQVRAWLDQ